MQHDAFELLAAAERDHWWFRGRREFIAAAIERAGLPASAQILDAGCGSGGNLPLLSQYGGVHGFEFDAHAADRAASLRVGTVNRGSLPDHIPFGAKRFDLIGLFDVLEHLEHPVESLAALRERLADGGAILISVPAYPWLWGPHDELHQHFRRYTAGSLEAHLTAAGLRVEYLSYFNSLLLPLAVAQRLRERFFGYAVADLTPSNAMNDVLLRIWRMERLWIPRWRAPFGLSLLAIARRR
ncbi:class I SAM-dependent methyltransferase [Gemmatimonas sp.]|jgi:SAM-dependent methyltransferase|uniref:class I SAM-dependent methyltransferase n=1 Tax=Gemmatimonas sp. TaxID=1962908 RepID=UPI0037BEE3F5